MERDIRTTAAKAATDRPAQGATDRPAPAGQKALVTGASSGIGKAVAIGMGRAGADVVVNYVSGPEAAEEVAETIRGFDVKALAVRADVSREDQVQAMFARALQEFGTVD